MKIRLLLFFLSMAVSLKVHAQDGAIPDLQQINAAVKSPYVNPGTLDNLRIELKYFDEHPAAGPEQQQILLDTYKAIVNGYAASSHYKQGYGVYQKYLALKENFLSAEKTNAIEKTNQSIEEQQRKDVSEFSTLQKEVKQLQEEDDHLLSKRKSFKHTFSLVIITLTVIFAFMLLQAGLRLNKLKHDLKAGRERLMVVHRLAALGKLKSGVVITIQSVFASIKNLVTENSKQIDQVSQLAGEKNPELTNLKKRMNELSSLTDSISS